MADRARFRRLFKRFLPGWATAGDGGLVLYSLTATMDLWFERLREGIRAKFPDYAPDDAIGLIGRDRKIVRGINEPKDAYAARLIRWLDDHRVRGNPYALMRQLVAYCQGGLRRVRTVDRNGNWYTIESDGSTSYNLAAGNWDWQGEGTDQWSRFWVILYPLPELWTEQVGYGEGLTWGEEDATWGTSATPDEIRGVQQIVRDWKPDGTRCVSIIVAFDGASFDPTDPPGAPLPDGLWGNYSKLVAGVRVRSRLSTARYWSPT